MQVSEKSTLQEIGALWKLITGSAVIASMCCLPSVILVMFGLASVSTAASLSNTLYWGEDGYAWFRPMLNIFSSICVIIGLILYFRREGICSFDEAKRQKRRVINISILVAIITILAYILLNYVILTEVGIALQLPWESSRLWN